MEEAVKFSFCQFKGKPVDVLRLTFLKGAFHAHFRGARLCFDCIKTPRFGLTAKGELLLIVAIYGFRRKRKNRSRRSAVFWIADPFINKSRINWIQTIKIRGRKADAPKRVP